MTLDKNLEEEFELIGLYQPVFAGDVLSKEDSRQLIELGLAMKYEGDYVLTEKGKELFISKFGESKLGSKTSNSYRYGK